MTQVKALPCHRWTCMDLVEAAPISQRTLLHDQVVHLLLQNNLRCYIIQMDESETRI